LQQALRFEHESLAQPHVHWAQVCEQVPEAPQPQLHRALLQSM